MWSNLSNITGNIANNASKFLEQLDETIDDQDEQYLSDGSDDAQEGNYKSTHLQSPQDSLKKEASVLADVEPVDAQAAGTAYASAVDAIPPPTYTGKPSQEQQGKFEQQKQPRRQEKREDEIKMLQEQLLDLKGERDNLKLEVSNQLKCLSSEMNQSIEALTISASAKASSNGEKGGDQALRLQLKEAEEKLVTMSREQTAHNQELEATIASLEKQIVEQRSYGNMKADEVIELKKRIAAVEQSAKERMRKAVGGPF